MAARELRPARMRLGGRPVLMYHGVLGAHEIAEGDREGKYWIPEGLLRTHLAVIGEGGRRAAPLRETWDVRSSGRPVTLSFDDGRASDYEVACPVLVAGGATAEFFVNTATVGAPGFLSWVQMREMLRVGMSFQSHSHDHVALVGLPPRVLEQQLVRSKETLEDRLGVRIDFLAAPYGFCDRQVVEVARRVGYRAVCDSVSWLARPGASVVNRIAVYPGTSAGALGRLLDGHPVPFARRAVRAGLTHVPKRLLLRLRPGRLGVRVLETGA